MKWSFSQHMIFKECPRKWYFAYKMAHTSSAKDLIKKEYSFFLFFYLFFEFTLHFYLIRSKLFQKRII